MEIKKTGLFLIGLCSAPLMAGPMGSVTNYTHWMISLGAAPLWTEAGETQTFYLTPEIVKTYAARSTTNLLPQGDIFVGVQRGWLNRLQAQVGIAVATTGDAKLSGEIWDDADPQFNNYIYNYRVSHTRVSLKGKLITDPTYFVSPWISGSIGVGFNYAHLYTNTPIIFEAVRNPDFSSHTQTAFTYTLGIGIQKELTDRWQVGVGYEFADWGKSQLGRATGQTLNSGLTLDHLYTNGVVFNIAYLM